MFTQWQSDVKTLQFPSALHNLVQPQDIISELLQDCSSLLLLLKDRRWDLIQTQLTSAENTPTVAAFQGFSRESSCSLLKFSFYITNFAYNFVHCNGFLRPWKLDKTGYCKISKGLGVCRYQILSDKCLYVYLNPAVKMHRFTSLSCRRRLPFIYCSVTVGTQANI